MKIIDSKYSHQQIQGYLDKYKEFFTPLIQFGRQENIRKKIIMIGNFLVLLSYVFIIPGIRQSGDIKAFLLYIIISLICLAVIDIQSVNHIRDREVNANAKAYTAYTKVSDNLAGLAVSYEYQENMQKHVEEMLSEKKEDVILTEISDGTIPRQVYRDGNIDLTTLDKETDAYIAMMDMLMNSQKMVYNYRDRNRNIYKNSDKQ